MRHYRVNDGEWIRPTPQVGYRMSCCDCGLAHTMNFKVIDGKVVFQAFRNNRATAARRRGYSGIKFKKKSRSSR